MKKLLLVLFALSLGVKGYSQCFVTYGTGTPITPCQYQFVGTGGLISSLQWTFGDGGTGTGYSPTHTYTANGTYTVCCIGIDIISGLPCDTSCGTVTVIGCSGAPSCNLVATAFATGGCNANFIASGLGVAAVSWDFGDGTFGTGLTTTHSYGANGAYAPMCVAYDSSGMPCDSFPLTVNITGCTGAGSCNLVCTAFMTGPCVAQFVAAGLGVATVNWNFGDGNTGSGTSTTHTYAGNGSYAVTAVAYDSTGLPCDTFTTTVNVTACTTGLSEESAMNSFSLYPNPTEGVLSLEFEQAVNVGYTVSAMNGTTVLQGNVNGTKTVLNTDVLEKGVYVVSLRTTNGAVVGFKRFIKL